MPGGSIGREVRTGQATQCLMYVAGNVCFGVGENGDCVAERERTKKGLQHRLTLKPCLD